MAHDLILAPEAETDVVDELVTVYGVLHTARDSAKWRHRFP